MSTTRSPGKENEVHYYGTIWKRIIIQAVVVTIYKEINSQKLKFITVNSILYQETVVNEEAFALNCEEKVHTKDCKIKFV